MTSSGELIRAGAPLVKNVTGFDLCRLLVGSLGTLALIGEVVLRCLPRPEVESWWVGEEADPFAIAAALYRPLSVLWDGARTWVGLAGFAADVAAQAGAVLGSRLPARRGAPASARAGAQVAPAPHPPGLAGRDRRVRSGGGWLAEVGVGVVHCEPRGGCPAGGPPGRRTRPSRTCTRP